MVKPSSKAVEELVSSVRSNVEVVRDALKAPATEESHAIVQDMMLDLKQSQEKLQKKAAELAESGQFESTNEIFEAIDQVTHLEPEFGAWSKSVSHHNDDQQIGASIHVEESPRDGDERKTKKKKKKKKKEEEGMTSRESAPVAESAGGWECNCRRGYYQ